MKDDSKGDIGENNNSLLNKQKVLKILSNVDISRAKSYSKFGNVHSSSLDPKGPHLLCLMTYCMFIFVHVC